MLDALIYIFLIIAIGIGVWRGFKDVLTFCVYGFVLFFGVVFTLYTYKHGAATLQHLVKDPDISKIIVFNFLILLIWIPGFIFGKKLLDKAFTDVELRWLDKFLGGSLSVVVILFIIWSVLFFMMIKGKNVQMIKTSSFAKTLVYAPGPAYDLLPKGMKSKFKESYQQIFPSS